MSIKGHFLGHANWIFETPDISILSDPVFEEVFEGGLNKFYPGRKVHLDKLPRYDVIFISHGHGDHFDPATLARLNRNAKVLYPAGNQNIEYCLKKFGYSAIFPVAANNKIQFKNTTLFFTASNVNFPELGLVIKHDDTVIWNAVDTILTEQTIDNTLALFGNIDLLLARYNPMLQTELREFPFGYNTLNSYNDLLKNALRINPSALAPSASGYRYDYAEWQNYKGFPVKPQTFLRDMSQINSKINAIPMLPGDSLTVEKGVAVQKSDTEQGEYLTVSKDEFDHKLWSLDPSKGMPDLEDTNTFSVDTKLDFQERILRYINTDWMELLGRDSFFSLRHNLRNWKVLWRLDLLFPNGERLVFSVDFAEEKLEMKRDCARDPAIWTAVKATDLMAYIDGVISDYNYHIGDSYRFIQRVYDYTSKGILGSDVVFPEMLSYVIDNSRDVEKIYTQKVVDKLAGD